MAVSTGSIVPASKQYYVTMHYSIPITILHIRTYHKVPFTYISSSADLYFSLADEAKASLAQHLILTDVQGSIAVLIGHITGQVLKDLGRKGGREGGRERGREGGSREGGRGGEGGREKRVRERVPHSAPTCIAMNSTHQIWCHLNDLEVSMDTAVQWLP